MSLMTPEDREQLPKGVWVKYKCDGCHKPIQSPMTFTGPNGEDFCSRACLSRGVTNEPTKKEKESKVKKASKADEAPAKKKVKGADDEKELKRKKSKAADDEDDEEETPKKKSKKSKDEDDEEEAPKKKSKKKAAEADDDEDEDEAPAKSKKAKKADKDEAPAHSGKNPYAKAGTAAYDAFEMARKGTTVKQINAMLKERGVATPRIWRELKCKDFRGLRWKYIEDEKGNVQIKLLKAKE